MDTMKLAECLMVMGHMEENEMSNDPMEALIKDALESSGIAYSTPASRRDATGLDFRLEDYGVEIEVKRFHSPRIERQMASEPNVIAVQGEDAAKFMARLLATFWNE